MAAGVEVSMVVLAATLEIDGAETVVAGKDVALAIGVEDRYAPLTAYVYGSIHHLQEVGVIVVPGCEPYDVGRRVAVDESLAHLAEPLAIDVDAHGVEQHGIVVAGNDDDEVERVGHLPPAFPQGRPKALAVYAHAAAVATVVQILHAVFPGQFVVPSVLHGFAVIANIAVADDGHAGLSLGGQALLSLLCTGVKRPERQDAE